MRTKYGNRVRVFLADDMVGVVTGSAFRDGFAVYMSPKKARKLAKNLVRHANEIERVAK